MNLETVPAKCELLRAGNGDPLLIFGEAEDGDVVLLPVAQNICRHPVAFARWTYRNAHRWKNRGKRLHLQHPMDARTRRWAQWLGVRFEGQEAVF